MMTIAPHGGRSIDRLVRSDSAVELLEEAARSLRALRLDAHEVGDLEMTATGPVPGALEPGASFGVVAADALERRFVDGFWANALGSETAVRRGVGKVIADVRRGDGPPGAGQYTFAALSTTEALIAREPDRVAAAVRAIVRTQRLLRKEPARATEVGRRRFPPEAAEIIAAIVERDLPFYDPVIPEAAVATMNGFAQAIGLLAAPVAYDEVVATRFRDLWSAPS
jgi:ABC-type nitrate/sulfonate/bicarbonate transport system substrate-binding protein